MGVGRRYVNWKEAEQIITANTGMERKQLAALCDCSVGANQFAHLCRKHGIMRPVTGRVRIPIGSRPKEKGAQPWEVKCPACQRKHTLWSRVCPFPPIYYCHSHEYYRQDDTDHDAIYSAGCE